MTDELIRALETFSEGSRELDGRVFCFVHGYTYRRYQPGTTSQLFYDDTSGDAQVTTSWPRYTTSLDAKLPGENIYKIIIPNQGPREAYHQDLDSPHQSYLGLGHTEALARRIAAMKAWKEDA